MNESPPDWTRLPHDPVTFFGLDAEFSRRDLKLSYNRLIRQFKPEKAPNEFQRIRAAYEVLDGQLRYGRTSEPVPVSGFDWAGAINDEFATTTTTDTAADNAADNAATQATPTFAERLQTSSASELYAHLNAQQQKSPRDFYALAVLSDVVKTQQKQVFLRWLLTGLQTHPEDPGLLTLLRELLRTEPPTPSAAGTLLAISKVVNDDRFYFLTEPVWDRLVVEIPFERLLQTLTACERNLRGLRVQGKVAFYVHLLRRVLWKAPVTWLEKTFQFLNEHPRAIEHGLEYDVEFAEAVFAYRQASEQIPPQGEVQQMIHTAICQFCEYDELKGDRFVIGCQTRLANDSEGVLAAWPCETNELAPMILAWEFISDDVASRQSEPPMPDTDEMVKSAFHCLRDCTRADNVAVWQVIFHGPYLLNFAVVVFVLAFVMLVTGFEKFLLGLGISAVAGLAFFPLARTLRSRLIRGSIRNRYRAVWRVRVARFAAATQLPRPHMLSLLDQASEAHSEEFYVGPWVVRQAAADPALVVYTIARQFLR